MKTAILINAQYYLEAGAFVTKQESRYTLRAVRVEPHPEKGALIIATDGHTLCLFHDAYGVCKEPTNVEFHHKALPFLKPSKDNKKMPYRCVRVNGSLDVVEARFDSEVKGYSVGKVIVSFPDSVVENATFPDWKRVLPKEVPSLRSDFNADYLRRCAMDKRSRGVTIWHSEPNDTPAIVRSMGRDDFVAIVMPMRGEAHPAYPSYVQPLLSPPVATEKKAATARKGKAA